jgi:hypothetical protein
MHKKRPGQAGAFKTSRGAPKGAGYYFVPEVAGAEAAGAAGEAAFFAW